ncbi:hypothetical protein CEXT_294731 [Caerostris extrusa]|uniref:Uncharacterized protein n=1 Tax=Caerostris extrusa TaxID=172846 RepID=A0AAV4PD97_CAEEX|nr:hypothetical protein CEXT_294731 [Caerostris extrusa]
MMKKKCIQLKKSLSLCDACLFFRVEGIRFPPTRMKQEEEENRILSTERENRLQNGWRIGSKKKKKIGFFPPKRKQTAKWMEGGSNSKRKTARGVLHSPSKERFSSGLCAVWWGRNGYEGSFK